jgi:hypothetical protein
MSRYFRQPQTLEVAPDAQGQPGWLRWLGRRERVWVCNTWRVEGPWWQGQQAGRAYYTLLTTATRAVLVVYRDEADGRWLLERVMD